MGRPVDLEKKVKELRSYLIQYNGIPTQQENQAAHANLNYYIKNHSDKPEIRALIEEFHIADNLEKKKEVHFQKKFEEIKTILENNKRIPKETNEYNKVYYFFNRYKSDPEVRKLMYVYVHADCFFQITGRPLYIVKQGRSNRPNCNFESAYKYVKFVYEKYKELPASRTIVYGVVCMHFRRRYSFKEEEKYEALEQYKDNYPFFRDFSELGCPDEDLFQFMDIEKK